MSVGAENLVADPAPTPPCLPCHHWFAWLGSEQLEGAVVAREDQIR